MNTEMRSRKSFSIAGIFCAAVFLFLLPPARLAAQSVGRIEFTAQIAPTGGRPEPVRQMTFYLLSKSLDEVQAEALQIEPEPDLNKFADSLSVSPELKAWMKAHHTASLSGSDFTKSLTAEEIVGVPEFLNAYMERNSGFKDVGFPKAKFREKDRESNPEKYKREKEEYTSSLRKFIEAVPETVQGLDADLTEINPSAKWERMKSTQRERLASRVIELAQQRYIQAQADTDLEGHGVFDGVTPGNYWISMIGVPAISGDVRLGWNLPATVRPGETTRVELSNRNAVRPGDTAQNFSR